MLEQAEKLPVSDVLRFGLASAEFAEEVCVAGVKGDELWKIFHCSDKAAHEWHYRGLAASLKELEDTFAYKEFVRLIDEVFSE